jgi:heme/copper-type cytochrome/quinol oxidase subunit 3
MKRSESAVGSAAVSASAKQSSQQRQAPHHRKRWGLLWTVLIDLWIFGVIAGFFVIRIVDSDIGQRVLATVHRHFR